MKSTINRNVVNSPTFHQGELLEFTFGDEQYITMVTEGTGSMSRHYKGVVLQSTMSSMPVGSSANNFLKDGVTKFYGTLTLEV